VFAIQDEITKKIITGLAGEADGRGSGPALLQRD